MGFPRRLLSDDEELVLDLRPHWIALVMPSIVGALTIVAAILVLSNLPTGWPAWVRWSLLLLAGALLVAIPVRGVVDWATSHFVLTSERVIHRSGWLARNSMEMPLERVNDVRFQQSILERMVGAGDLTIESAGEYGQNHFSNIRRPEEVQKLIYEMGEANEEREARAPASSPASEDDGEETPLEQIERLGSLRERGLISEEEYETQKRRLLGRL
jgi:uncharacterized membrane protein YdbT with pleckstrin-like domain